MSEPSAETMGLIRQAADGDHEAFRTLVRRVYPRLRRWALARTGDPDLADEAVQRTLIRMHRGLPGFAGDSALSSWLYRILGNAVIDLHRSESARPTGRAGDGFGGGDGGTAADSGGNAPAAGGRGAPLETASESPDPVRAIHAGRMADAVRDFFDVLPPRQREIVELVDHEGLRPVDVAEMLEIKPVTVRANLFKARRALRERILERYPELTEGYEA